MSDVKRYEHFITGIEEYDTGDYVRYEDYAELRRQLEQARKTSEYWKAEVLAANAELEQAEAETRRLLDILRSDPGSLEIRVSAHNLHMKSAITWEKLSLTRDPDEAVRLYVIDMYRKIKQAAEQKEPE